MSPNLCASHFFGALRVVWLLIICGTLILRHRRVVEGEKFSWNCYRQLQSAKKSQDNESPSVGEGIDISCLKVFIKIIPVKKPFYHST